jgi:MFS family permease
MTLPGGTAIQVVQEAVPNALRGQASAIYYMFISVIGLTCGPLSVGLLNDYLFADPNRLGHSMAIVAAIVGPLTALLTLSTRAPFDRMLAAAERSASAAAPDAPR